MRLRIEREGYATIEQLVVLDRDVELVHVLEVAPTSSTRTGTPQGTTMASTMASTMAPTTESVSGMETSMETSTTNPPDTMGGTSMDGFRDDF